MRVSTKLGAAFALHIALFVALMVHHVRTIRDVASTGLELTEISARIYSSAAGQALRIAQLEENAAKLVVTLDRGYHAMFRELSTEFATELGRLHEQPLTEPEQRELRLLTEQWREFEGFADRLDDLAARAPRAADSLAFMQVQLDTLRARSQRLSEASHAAMLAQLGRNAGAARRAERLSWLGAGGALLLGVLIAVVIVRSITDALARLTEGTREVARGRFGYRLDTTRGDEFAQVARDFNTMTERLDELEQMKRDFVSKVSHDLKTPLASMQETIDALLDGVAGDVTPRQRRLLELNYQSGERLFAMLGKLLDLSRLEAGAVPPRIERVNVAALVREAAVMHSRTGAAIDVHMPTTPLHLHCDRDRVLQLLHNLIENAVKYATPGGVAVSATPAEDDEAAIRIVVSDDGPGIPDEDKERVFERFYQGEAGRRAPGRGVGLGLTIVREIVAVHGGSIHVQDRPGGGTEFHVLLPDNASAATGSASESGRTEVHA